MFGKRKEPTVVNVDKVDTILGKGADFTGNLKSAGILRIEGKFQGDIECEQDLVICEGSRVDAEVKARHAIVAGTYRGNMQLEGKLEIRNTGKVHGDVKVDSLVIEEGAFFDGNCEMSNGEKKNNKYDKKQKQKGSNPT